MSTALATFIVLVAFLHQTVDARMSQDGFAPKPSGAQKNRVHVRHHIPGSKQPFAKCYQQHGIEIWRVCGCDVAVSMHGC